MKEIQIFAYVYINNGDESYLHVSKKGIYKFKAKDNISWYSLYLERVSKDFAKDEHSEIC